MLETQIVTENLNERINDLVNEVTDRVFGQNLPFVANLLLGQSSNLFTVMGELQNAIDDVLSVAEELSAEEVVKQLNEILLSGAGSFVKADLDDDGNVTLQVSFDGVTSLAGLDLDAGASLGLSTNALSLDADVSVDVELAGEFLMVVDVNTFDVTIDGDAIGDEFTIDVNGEVAFALAAQNALGFLDVSLTDNEPNTPGAPKDDLQLEIGVNFQDTDPTEVSMDGRARLDFNVMAGAPDLRVLPEFGANVFLEVNYSNADILNNGEAAQGDFTIELRDVVFKLEALAGVLQDVFSTVSDILNTFPIGEIVDLLVQRLPVIDDLAPNSFDFDDDGKITLQDVITLISVLNPSDTPPAFGLIQGVILLAEVIDAVDQLAEGLAEDGCFDIGTLRLTSEALETISNGAPFPDAARLISSEDSDLQNLADLVEAFGAFNDFISLDEEVEEASVAPQARTLAQSATPANATQSDEGGPFDLPDVGLSFPFLASPEALADSLASLLLNGFGTPAVTLVEFDLPPLEFCVYDEIGFRFGPFVGNLFGTFYAGVDINIGYDTAGFGENFDFLEGLFIAPDLPEVEVNGETKTPVGTVALGVGVNGGLDVFIARAVVEGGLLGTIDVFLGGTGPGDNKARLSELGGCFFNDIAGRLTAGIDIVLRFGFGVFSFEKRLGIAEVTLAQFNIDPCNPSPKEVLDELEVETAGLAREEGDTLILHVGEEAENRTLPDDADAELKPDGTRKGKAETETFFVGLVPEDENNPAGPNEIAVFAFGIFQRFGTGATELVRIVGNGGSANDRLTVSENLTLDAELSGGDGNDVVIGGSGNDELSGDDGNDQLDGDIGNDTLFGGKDNDILRGGLGADSIDGGDGFDQIDFSESASGISLIESASTPGLMLGFGGEAQGDRVRDVEHFIGSAFDDTFYGNTEEGNIFESGAGDDVLVGGDEEDLFIGGAGADVKIGARPGEVDNKNDAASYVFSPTGVLINLEGGFGVGGDAQGDVFYGIEDFQLSSHADRFIGDDEDNLVDGYDGDDILEGGLGRDTILAGVGNDIVLAMGDGDDLDGGGFLNYRPDRDLLSYANAADEVVVDLHDGFGRLRSNVFVRDDIAFAQSVAVNPDGENSIVTRGSNQDPRLSSFEDLEGSSFNDDLRGDDRANTVNGGLGDDDIDGEGGNDILIGGLGGDTITGGNGIDTADYRDSSAGVIANLTAGVVGVGGHAQGDTFETVENLIGSRFVDQLIGNALNNRLDPYLREGNGVERLIGNDGIDTGVVDFANQQGDVAYDIDLSDKGSGAAERIVTNGADIDLIQFQTLEQLEVYTGNGDDDINSRALGNDVVNSAGGDDTINMGAGFDRVFAGTGDDVVGRITLAALDGNRFAGAKNDMRATYILDGGAGIDQLSADISYTQQDIVWVARAPGDQPITRNIVLEAGAVIRNFETLGILITGSGDDFIGQQGDVDTVFSTTEGADTVITGLGIDIADGGESGTQIGALDLEDVDTLVIDYSFATTAVTSDTAVGYDGVIRVLDPNSVGANPLHQVTHADFERILLTSGSGNDHLIGSSDSYDNLVGPTPGDVLYSGDGNDTLEGLVGDDTLSGGEGRDVLFGGAGNDVLIGANRGGEPFDRDTMTGGEGADLFILGDAGGIFYSIPEESAFIVDFDTTEGDRLQLSGGPGDYRIEDFDPFIFGNSIVFPHVIFINDPNTGLERPIANVNASKVLTLGDASIIYTGGTAVGAATPAVQRLDSIVELGDDVASSNELTGLLWKAGAVSDDVLLDALQSDEPADGWDVSASPAAQASAELALAEIGSDATIKDEDATVQAAIVLDAALKGIARPTFEFDNFSVYGNVEISGAAAASGIFDNMFGLKSGFALSTGRVDQILGENTEDGRFTQGPRPATQAALDFVELGTFEGGTLYRAEVPDLPGGIESLTLTDDADYLGGAAGWFTAFDVDALFFSDQLLTSAGLSRAVLNALPKLDVIDYNVGAIDLSPGPQRPGGFQVGDLWGSTNGMIDFDLATLDVADWNNLSNLNAAGALSIGEGGSIGLNLNTPLEATGRGPNYLYIYEIGGQENLDGVVQVSDKPIGVEGDLSTDLGAPGIEDDTTTLFADFFVDFNDLETGPGVAPFTTIEFFDLVIVSEELPERGGAELPDLVSVKVNGLDVLTDGTGSVVTLNNLAFTPYGDYAPELTLNLETTGPLAEELRADAFTSVYRVSGPIIDGLNTIEVSVSDQADAFLDTAVFIAPIDGQSIPANQAPVARNDSTRVDENANRVIDLIDGFGQDTDADGDPLSVVAARLISDAGAALQTINIGTRTELLSGGAVTVTSGGDFAFETDRDFDALGNNEFEALKFAYVISDGTTTDEAQVTVIVDGSEPVNSPPVFTSPDAFTTPENSLETFQIAATDSDGPSQIQYAILNPTSDGGLFQINAATGALRFVDAPDHEDPLDQDGDNVYSVTIGAGDGEDVVVDVVDITVTNVEEPCDGRNRIEGTSGDDELTATADADCFDTGDGADTILSTFRTLSDDLILDFDEADTLIISDLSVASTDIEIGSKDASFRLSRGDGEEISFSFLGDYDDRSFEIQSSGGQTTIRLAAMGATDLGPESERFITIDDDVNKVFGAEGADVIITAGGADLLSGGLGPDVMLAGDGDDLLLGGRDADLLNGGRGADIFGFDAKDFAPGFTVDRIEDFTPGEDRLLLTGFEIESLDEITQSEIGGNLIFDLKEGRIIAFEGLTVGDIDEDDVSFGKDGEFYTLLSTGNVRTLSADGDRYITIGETEDIVHGGDGDDVVISAGGNDQIFGGLGADVIIAGTGNDFIRGGAGSDNHTGGDGADEFVFVAGETLGFTVDIITDFQTKEDVIRLQDFGLAVDDLIFNQVNADTLAVILNPTHFVVLEGYGSVEALGDLDGVFDFG